MRPGGGKQKGSAFEREICKQLSRWLSRDSRDDLFWRSSMSGGRATIGLTDGYVRGAQAGDISPIATAGIRFVEQFYIECKNYEDIQIQNLLKSNGKLYKFWNETVEEADKYSKAPLLIWKQNFWPKYISTDVAGLDKFGYDSRMVAHTDCPCLMVNMTAVTMFSFELDPFLKLSTPLRFWRQKWKDDA